MLKRLCIPPLSNSFFIFGPRATGKTTLVKQNFAPDKTHFIDLLNSPKSFKRNHSAAPYIRRGYCSR
mgnify:CR=1 FL=1